MREAKIEEYLVARARAMGGEAIKVGHSSWPDRIVVLPGPRYGWVELKRPGQAARKAQELRIQRLRVLGCLADVCASLAAVERFLEHLATRIPACLVAPRCVSAADILGPGHG